MKKALKSILAVVLALTMIMSCSFASTASAAPAAMVSSTLWDKNSLIYPPGHARQGGYRDQAGT